MQGDGGESVTSSPERAGGSRPAVIGVGKRLCPCGREVPTHAHGFWWRLGNYVIIPALTLGLYTLAVLVGVALAADQPVAALVIGLLPVLSLVVTTVIQLAGGHRWLCLVQRSVGWWLWWPGGVFAAIALS
ncbi:hypothetical protein [Ornithinimicrobium cavernae]|uniref:hypothetical protein n=1 Tax=Ornithinimicrobium cavernae TaxID=2666047 RepID=UPI000D68AD9F|nr:hypothetical protein [Ornithinimicrobium cavernae]